MFGSIISSLSSIGSAFADKSESREQRRDDEDFQREMAQNGLSWKIKDAWTNRRKIHPLVSLGANTHSASAITPRGANVPRADYSGIGKFLDDKTINKKSAALDLERKQVEIDLLKKDLNKDGLNTKPVGSNKVEIQPAQVTAKKKNKGITAGIHSLFDHYEDDKGRLHLMINEKAGESLEADTVARYKIAYSRIKDMTKRIQVTRGYNIKALRKLNHDLIIFRNILPPAGNGKTWKYNHKEASWQRVYGKRTNNIFLDKKLNNHLNNYHKIPNPWKKNKSSNPNYRRYR